MNITRFNNDQHLTQEELMAYQQGNLSNKEMHRLELHLIDCTLCNDAIEGTTIIEEVELAKNLASIRAKTNVKISKGFTTKHWLAIAASFVLIAIVSTILLIFPAKQETMIAEKLPAKEDVSELLKDKVKTSGIIVDTVIESTPTESNLIAETEAEESATQIVNQPISEDILAADDLVEENLVADQPVLSDSDTNNLDLAGQTDLVADENVEGLAIADVSIEEEQFAEQGADTRSKKIAAPAETPPIQGVQTSEAELQEIIEYKAAEPEKGMRAFSRYLKRNLKYPTAAKENNIEGEVILEVTLNAEGVITNVGINQSLGFGCDQEAIRLINEGPKWVPGSKNGVQVDDMVMVVIPFKQ